MTFLNLIVFLDLIGENDLYDEKPLPKIKSGRYVTYLMVDKYYKGCPDGLRMGTVGCFGYLEKEASEKYPHPIQHGGKRLEFSKHRILDGQFV